MELSPGGMLGPYRLIEWAGAGGMAEVWRAYQPSLERYVAIKVLPRHYAGQPGYLERFRREALAISRLEHPNILTVHDFGEQDGFTYMVTPFIAGGTLAARLGRPWTPGEARRMLEPLASALDYAHTRGIIHRDVKPSNVLISHEGRVILGDFGIARVLEATAMLGEPGRLTQSGMIIGTPQYMAPEQVLGQPAAARSDLNALGVIAYELLTGRPPFRAETPMAVALAHLHNPLPPPRSVNPGLSEAVEAVLFKALAKDPDDRYPGGSVLVGALEDAEHDESFTLATRLDSEPDPTEPRLTQLPSPWSSRPLVLPGLVGALLVAAVTLGRVRWLDGAPALAQPHPCSRSRFLQIRRSSRRRRLP